MDDTDSRISALEKKLKFLTQKIQDLEKHNNIQSNWLDLNGLEPVFGHDFTTIPDTVLKEKAVQSALAHFELPSFNPSQISEPIEETKSIFMDPPKIEDKLLDLPTIEFCLIPQKEETKTEEKIKTPIVPIEFTKSAGIEVMKHLVGKFELMWGFTECHTMLEGLIVQEQPSEGRSTRQGFDPKIMSEILFLQRLLGYITPPPQGSKSIGGSAGWVEIGKR